jgi:hypothetical protein
VAHLLERISTVEVPAQGLSRMLLLLLLLLLSVMLVVMVGEQD